MLKWRFFIVVNLLFALLMLVSFTSETTVYTEDELLGKINPASHSGFARIAKEHTTKPQAYLRTEVYEAFKQMHAASKKDGVQLMIISATRTFEQQKAIWERKWKSPGSSKPSDSDLALMILEYSSMPGTSRHHWGTDMDFNSLEPAYFKKGEGKKIHDWLTANGPTFGFYQTYTSKSSGRTGYNEEAWHWTYLPTSKEMLRQYNATITCDKIKGFSGSAEACTLNVIDLYVNGIDASLKN